jgi:AraC family transcriptional regulator, regulatory protein of adaptative response / methylated-DNA-[protein]-cysteine methyltransferase
MDTPVVDYRPLNEDYLRIEQAIRYLEQNAQRQPELGEIADAVGLSEFHFQRLFTRWAGISPKRFLQFLTKENAKDLLDRTGNLLDTTQQVGLSSLGRLHDLFVTAEAVTPGEYKSRGAGVTIRYGLHPTPFGQCLIGLTDRGICHLAFVQASEGDAIDELSGSWEQASMVEDQAATAPLVEPIFDLNRRGNTPLRLHLRGTNFQLKVWEALLLIEPGTLTTYGHIASLIGRPSAMRAVGNAVGQNPVPVLIPCHRVIRNLGEFGNYRYGSARKKALLGWEMSKTEIEKEPVHLEQ